MFVKPYFQPKYTHNIKLKELEVLIKLNKLKVLVKLDKLKVLLPTLKVPYKSTKPTKTVIKYS